MGQIFLIDGIGAGLRLGLEERRGSKSRGSIGAPSYVQLPPAACEFCFMCVRIVLAGMQCACVLLGTGLELYFAWIMLYGRVFYIIINSYADLAT
jgi:hypothetical protein